jgi:hypothetical protein
VPVDHLLKSIDRFISAPFFIPIAREGQDGVWLGAGFHARDQ